MDFMLVTEYIIRGDQLVDEILSATGIDLENYYVFLAPDIVRVADAIIAGREVEIQAIIDVHVPDPLYFPADLVREIEQGTDAQIAAVPGWAHWTVEQAGQWHTSNISNLLPVGNLAEANTLLANVDTELRAMSRMLIAMRNKLWPELEGSE